MDSYSHKSEKNNMEYNTTKQKSPYADHTWKSNTVEYEFDILNCLVNGNYVKSVNTLRSCFCNGFVCSYNLTYRNAFGYRKNKSSIS